MPVPPIRDRGRPGTGRARLVLSLFARGSTRTRRADRWLLSFPGVGRNARHHRLVWVAFLAEGVKLQTIDRGYGLRITSHKSLRLEVKHGRYTDEILRYRVSQPFLAGVRPADEHGGASDASV